MSCGLRLARCQTALRRHRERETEHDGAAPDPVLCLTVLDAVGGTGGDFDGVFAHHLSHAAAGGDTPDRHPAAVGAESVGAAIRQTCRHLGAVATDELR